MYLDNPISIPNFHLPTRKENTQFIHFHRSGYLIIEANEIEMWSECLKINPTDLNP